MRDHRKLEAFEFADKLAKLVYVVTRDWPSDERFGLTAQVRRGSVSVASNIVEGCARETEADFRHFVVIAHSACRELHYQLTLASFFGYSVIQLEMSGDENVVVVADRTARILAGLVRSLKSGSGPGPRTQDPS